MGKKRTYQTERVQQIDSAALLPLLAAGCIVALDVAKTKFVVALATLAGEVVKLFRFNHPDETHLFLGVMKSLQAAVDPEKTHVVMEPTGTYGDAIRSQLVKQGFHVSMVSPHRTHDSQALFDGVRSLHDPKSAVLVAKLFSLGLAMPWKEPSSASRSLRALVDLRRHEQAQQEPCMGRLEAVVVRHWPELQRWLDVRGQKSALSLLIEFTSPEAVTKAPKEAAELLRKASRGRLSKEVIDGVIASAASTMGVEMIDEERAYVRALASAALEARGRFEGLDERMRALETSDDAFRNLSGWMGTYSAAVLVTMCHPLQYKHAKQLEKACGLNLREKSSGEHKGRLAITKRGPGAARQVLHLLAIRMLQSSHVVRAWYEARRSYTQESKQRAVVAVTRKLVKAAFHVARGNAFDARKLFDVERLNLRDDAPSDAHKPAFPPQRKAMRTSSIARTRSAATTPT